MYYTSTFLLTDEIHKFFYLLQSFEMQFLLSEVQAASGKKAIKFQVCKPQFLLPSFMTFMYPSPLQPFYYVIIAPNSYWFSSWFKSIGLAEESRFYPKFKQLKLISIISVRIFFLLCWCSAVSQYLILNFDGKKN